MIKQLSLFTLLYMAFSLNASLPVTSAATSQRLTFAPLTNQQQKNVWDLNDLIQDYLDAFDDGAESALIAIEERLNERVFVEVPAPLAGEFISLTKKIQNQINRNNERAAALQEAGLKPSAKLASDAARLKVVKELLDAHLLAHGVVVMDYSQLKKDEHTETRRGGSHSSGSGKGFRLCKLGRRILWLSGAAILSYAVVRIYQSQKGKK